MSPVFRHQLPAHSPVDARGLLRATGALTGRSGVWPNRLETHLRERFEVADAILCGSGTHALQLALRLGTFLDESARAVILPAYSCFDLATAAVWAGRPVRFYDLDPASLGPDTESLGEALAAGPATVVVSPLFGIPVDWDLVGEALGTSGTVVVEDAAQGHGARWRGRPLGGQGRLGVLSFSRGKGWTGGAGGALLIRDAGDARRWSESVRASLKGGRRGALAGAFAQWLFGRPAIFGIPRALPFLGLGETRYRRPTPPQRLPQTAAPLLLATLEMADREAGFRRERARELRGALELRGSAAQIRVPEGGDAGYIRYPFLLPGGLATLRASEEAVRMGAAGGYPVPLPELKPLAHLLSCGADATGWPGAQTLARNLVTFPTHRRVSPQELESLVALVPAGGL